MERTSEKHIFRPGGTRYLVLPDPVEEDSVEVGGFSISTGKDAHKKSTTGRVIARGRTATEYAVDSTVVYGQYSGYAQKLDGVDHVVLQETEILGELCGTPFDRDPANDLKLTERN